MIDQWTNPYTEEVVDVVHVANDPFNYTISEWLILRLKILKRAKSGT